MYDCMITGYVNCWSLYDITSYVVCCAKCHFLPFLPASSISQPPYWKMLPVAKTPENSTLRAYRLILPAYDTKRSHFRHYRTKIRKMADQNRRVKIWYVVRYALHISHFLVNTIYHNIVNLISSTTHIIPTILSHQISYSIQWYRYYNTVITL